ncbi:MlaD family protein [Patulibacter medicamentivorans]|uniref:MlaD family protein n=1 Tax=Patulibacter medicamentivorans TaxID=1097667 RepID=UPI0002F3C82D|nr:MlaD family protein [Patulibacter medicamentivorans]
MPQEQSVPRTPLRRLGPSSGPQPPRRRGPNPVVGGVRWLVGHPWSIVGAAFVVWFAFWVIGTREQKHHVKAAFSSAFNITPGLDVQVDGLDVGKVGKVEYQDGRAIVEIGVNDDDYWPLPQGTTVKTRYGTTIGSGTRRLDLHLGPKGAPAIPDGGIIAAKDTRPAVDVDQVLNTLNDDTRGKVKSLQGNVDSAVSGTERDANRGLAATGRGIRDIDGFLADLGSDSAALRGLVANTDRLTRTLASRAPQVSDLVTVGARTFEAFGSRSREIQQTLDGVPGAMAEARTTLARVDGSVGTLTGLVGDLEPGAKRLKPLARAATPALRQLYDIVPTALSTVRTTTRVAPALNSLLTDGSPFVTKAERILREAKPMIACIRPYTPEAAGAVVGLGGWLQSYQLKDKQAPIETQLLDQPMPYRGREENGKIRLHGIRARINASTATLHAWPPIVTTELFTKIGLKQYAYPRPPGLIRGEPWFQPQCGVGPESLDPSKDPEERDR